MDSEKTHFIRHYKFKEDKSKPGRVLEWVKVGDVYVSRLFIQPGVVTANFYHKETNTIMFVEEGRVKMKYVQVNTGKSKEMVMTPGSGIVHMPHYVAVANKNIGRDVAVVILLSDKPFRSGDDYDFPIYPPTKFGKTKHV